MMVSYRGVPVLRERFHWLSSRGFLFQKLKSSTSYYNARNPPRESFANLVCLTYETFCRLQLLLLFVVNWRRQILKASTSFFFTLLLSSFNSGQAVVARVIRSTPRFLPFIFYRVSRVQQSHFLSIVHRVLMPRALAFSASQFVHTQKSPRIFTRMHSGGFQLTKQTYIITKEKHSSCEIVGYISSKLIFASCVWYSNRANHGLCVLIKDIGRRLPLQLQCSHQGQRSGARQSVRGNYKNRFWGWQNLTAMEGNA